MSATLQIEEIQTLLPQRFPFLFIDRVVNLDLQNSRIECYKNVSVNEEFFQGHFPGHPVMPGVLIIEAMAQAAGILGSSMGEVAKGKRLVYYFAAADRVRFRTPVIPGDTLHLSAEFITVRRNIWKFSCEARVQEQLVSSAIIQCAKREFDS